MSDTRYPLCMLIIDRDKIEFNNGQLEFLERIFANAPVVYGREHKQNPPIEIDVWCTREHAGCNEPGYKPPTRSARLLFITPLAPPEKEEIRLLREIVKDAYQVDFKTYERAKAFLARLDGGRK